MELQVRDICRTNLSKPGGMVRILSIEPFWLSSPDRARLVADVEHIEDHPYGYRKGETGYYFVEDLILVERKAE